MGEMVAVGDSVRLPNGERGVVVELFDKPMNPPIHMATVALEREGPFLSSEEYRIEGSPTLYRAHKISELEVLE